jgi:TIR domain
VTGKIFISYRRRDDPGGAGRLFDALNEAFDPDRLFLDVDSIEPGQDFEDVIEDRVAKSAVLLAVIGQHWVDATDDRGNRRLDNPQDYVRMEIETAMKQNKRVIPVLIGDARMPAAEVLPESIRKLARHNAVMLRYERFHDDITNLVSALKRAMGDDLTPPAPAQVQPVYPVPPQERPSGWPAKVLQARVPLLAFVVVAALLGGGAYLYTDLYSDTDSSSGGTVYQPSSVPGTEASVVPGPVASVVPPPSPAPVSPPAPAKPAQVAIATPAPPPTPAPAPASAAKPNWCSEDHLKQDELTICATASLWGLDSQLNDVYRKYSSTASDPKAVGDDELKWVRETRRPCATEADCINRAYLARIAYFNTLLARK